MGSSSSFWMLVASGWRKMLFGGRRKVGERWEVERCLENGRRGAMLGRVGSESCVVVNV